jgi:hypothetical protein
MQASAPAAEIIVPEILCIASEFTSMMQNLTGSARTRVVGDRYEQHCRFADDRSGYFVFVKLRFITVALELARPSSPNSRRSLAICA